MSDNGKRLNLIIRRRKDKAMQEAGNYAKLGANERKNRQRGQGAHGTARQRR